jgi:hypothetical protein
MKVEGNALFSNKQYSEALVVYSRALDAIGGHERLTSFAYGLRLTLLSNRAACHLGLESFAAAVDDCTAVLASNPRHSKALFRRARVCACVVLFVRAPLLVLQTSPRFFHTTL